MNNESALSDIQIKDRLLVILEIIIDACRKNNLRYYVYAGTLIGAIRHNGFIPWDDDIDICMPRNDYDKLYDALSACSDVKVFNCDHNENYIHTFMKVADNATVISMPNSKDDRIMGVFVDVFPLDALGDTYNFARKRMIKFTLHRSIAVMANQKSFMHGRSSNPFIKIGRVAAYLGSKIFFSRKLLKKINQIAREFDYDSSTYVGNFVDATYGEKEINKREYFGDGIEVNFERLKVMVPSNYNEILTRIYGEYMKLPPKEKQVPIHEYTVYYVSS